MATSGGLKLGTLKQVAPGATVSVLLAAPAAVGVLVALNALSASRPLALAVLSVLVAATALGAAILDERHGKFGAR